MTPEELETLVREGPTETLIEALAGMTEPERRKLSRAAADLRRSIRKEDDLDPWSVTDAWARVELAVCGLSSFTEAKRTRLLGEFVRDKHEALVARVLADRKPDWLERLVQHDGNRRGVLMRDRWDFPRELVRRGAIAPPTDDAYIESMVKTLASAGWRAERSLADRLREDHRDLLEHQIWRIFEIEPAESGPFDGHIAGQDARTGWPCALAELANARDIDRDRLIDAVVRAFRSAPGMQRSRFLVRVHKELVPKKAECVARRSAYAEALGCAHANIVTAAAKALVRSGSPVAGEVAPYVRASLSHEQKGAGRAVLKMLALLGAEGAELAAHGLASPLPEIQSEALDLIEKLVDAPAPGVAAALRKGLDAAVPSQRTRADALAARLAGEEPTAVGEKPPTSPISLDEVRARAAACAHRDVAGLAACLEGRIEPVRLHPFDVGRLRDPVTPIASVEELAMEWTRHAEAQPEVERIERLLDGTLRLCADRPDDFETLIAPVRQVWAPREDEWAVPPGLEYPVVRSWCGTWQQDGNPFFEKQSHAFFWFLGARLAEIAAAVNARRPRQLLATPTHTGAWIDPRVFVRRLIATRDVQPADLVQALLRLAPDHRDEALIAADALPSSLRGWIRFALGGDASLAELSVPAAEPVEPVVTAAPPKSASVFRRLRDAARAIGLGAAEPVEAPKPEPFVPLVPRSALVAAVCRARDPWGTFDGGENEGGVDARAVYLWEIVPVSTTRYDGWRAPGVDVEVTPAQKIGRPYDDHILTPTAALHRRLLQRKTYADEEPSLQPHLGGVWPADPSDWFRCGVRETVRRLDSPVSSYSPRSLRLEPFFDPDMPLTEIAGLLLILALCAKDEDLRATARDATLTLTHDGRMDAELVGRVSARLVEGGVVKAGRLATSLAEIADASLSATHAVAGVLGLVAARCPSRSLIPVLTTLREAYTTLHAGPPDELRTTLAAVPGKGKAAKLAREVATMSGPGRADALLLEALESRIARAHRYAELDWMPAR